MKKFGNNKILLALIIFTILTSFVAVYLFFFHQKKIEVMFTLNGDNEIILEANSKYEEPGYDLIVNGKNIKKAQISSELNLTKPGDYYVNYIYQDENGKIYKINRKVKIKDTIPPEISLIGNDTINLVVGKKYEEPGFKAIDNCDGDITNKVVIESNVDTKKTGKYTVSYKVEDSSHNTSTIQRKVNVTKPKPIIATTNTKGSEKKTDTTRIINNYDNTLTYNKFNSNNIYLEGYLSNNNGTIILRAKNNENSIDFNMTVNNNKYTGNIDVNKLPNGEYELFVISQEEKRLQTKMEKIDRLARGKVNNKLVTFIYENDLVKIKVEDFNYEYDILIDVGHGGSDSGASNGEVYEKDMNLEVSKYEKCRYEQHGLKVKMNRENDSYGMMMGETSWNNLSRRAYALGYYGVVSKIAYSNHHNSTTNSRTSGYELLTPSNYESLELEKSIINEFNGIYNLQENHLRMYARNYDNGRLLSTLNNEKYNIKDYYCIIRVPYQLFNTKMIIFEGTYISNPTDFNWYWKESNWKRVSEIKIKKYVESLGVTYISDSNC